jgi:hypothetical protein
MGPSSAILLSPKGIRKDADNTQAVNYAAPHGQQLRL